ncbi:MAG: N-glycosylase/DNA lyase [Ignavibacteriales bacterium]|nr:N-glycosylase/DNA lyase [Ignavibacteriales bacterium]
MTDKRKQNIKDLTALHESRKKAIQSRLNDFSRLSPDKYFYELIYCLLTPQSSAQHADNAVRALQIAGFAENGFDPEQILRIKEHYVRFHKTKAKRLIQVRENFATVTGALSNSMSPFDLREWLVFHVKGLGYKEATHFLRNIGKNGGLAILDRHILRNLKRFGVIRALPKSLSRKKYFVIEKKFADFAQKVGVPVDELDLLFWSMETGEIRK